MIALPFSVPSRDSLFIEIAGMVIVPLITVLVSVIVAVKEMFPK